MAMSLRYLPLSPEAKAKHRKHRKTLSEASLKMLLSRNTAVSEYEKGDRFVFGSSLLGGFDVGGASAAEACGF